MQSVTSVAELKLLLTTFADDQSAADIVRTLVRERLVACGTLLPRARSIYVWDGKLADTEEIVVLLKTTAGRAEAAADRLRDLHPYDCPEILAVDPQCLNPAYATWVAENTNPL